MTFTRYVLHYIIAIIIGSLAIEPSQVLGGGEGCGKIVFSILESFPVATRQVTGWKSLTVSVGHLHSVVF